MQTFITYYCDRVAALLPPEKRGELNRLTEMIAIGLQEGGDAEFLTKHWKYLEAQRPWESEEYENAYAQERESGGPPGGSGNRRGGPRHAPARARAAARHPAGGRGSW